jgi:hypothetical protein
MNTSNLNCPLALHQTFNAGTEGLRTGSVNKACSVQAINLPPPMEPSVNLYALSRIWMKILRSSGLCKHKSEFLVELI